MRIGILLGVMPRMLHDVVRGLVDAESDMYVVGEDVEAGGLIDCVDRERPDVVVLAVPSAAPSAVAAELLNRFPRLSVLALEDRGERASVYLLRPMRFRFVEPSGPELITAIRRAAVAGPLANVYDAGAQLLDPAPVGAAVTEIGRRNSGEQPP